MSYPFMFGNKYGYFILRIQVFKKMTFISSLIKKITLVKNVV